MQPCFPPSFPAMLLSMLLCTAVSGLVHMAAPCVHGGPPVARTAHLAAARLQVGPQRMDHPQRAQRIHFKLQARRASKGLLQGSTGQAGLEPSSHACTQPPATLPCCRIPARPPHLRADGRDVQVCQRVHPQDAGIRNDQPHRHARKRGLRRGQGAGGVERLDGPGRSRDSARGWRATPTAECHAEPGCCGCTRRKPASPHPLHHLQQRYTAVRCNVHALYHCEPSAAAAALARLVPVGGAGGGAGQRIQLRAGAAAQGDHAPAALPQLPAQLQPGRGGR